MIKKRNIGDGVESEAVFSDCLKYRYVLTRIWNTGLPRIVFIGLNPSTADEVKNDPTVARMINYAKNFGYGSAVVLNLFAFRATFPAELKKHEEPIGKENDKLIARELKMADKIVVCWGNHGLFTNRSAEVRKLFKNAECFGLTKLGEPRHVLYLKRDAALLRLREPSRLHPPCFSSVGAIGSRQCSRTHH